MGGSLRTLQNEGIRQKRSRKRQVQFFVSISCEGRVGAEFISDRDSLEKRLESAIEEIAMKPENQTLVLGLWAEAESGKTQIVTSLYMRDGKLLSVDLDQVWGTAKEIRYGESSS